MSPIQLSRKAMPVDGGRPCRACCLLSLQSTRPAWGGHVSPFTSTPQRTCKACTAVLPEGSHGAAGTPASAGSGAKSCLGSRCCRSVRRGGLSERSAKLCLSLPTSSPRPCPVLSRCDEPTTSPHRPEEPESGPRRCSWCWESLLECCLPAGAPLQLSAALQPPPERSAAFQAPPKRSTARPRSEGFPSLAPARAGAQPWASQRRREPARSCPRCKRTSPSRIPFICILLA